MKIEIWSDIVCPWCYVGKRRLETALESFDGDVEIEWRSFELDPNAPQSTKLPLDQALARKYGMSQTRAREMMDNMRQMGADEGLDMRFEDAQTGNTFAAHQLIHLAKSKGLGPEMKERLLRAYFTEGKPIADHDTLVALAEDVGLDAGDAREMLEASRFETNVRDDEREARQIGVTGVPFFLIDGKFGVSGAQMPDTLLHVLNRARDEQQPDVAAGDACDIDDPTC